MKMKLRVSRLLLGINFIFYCSIVTEIEGGPSFSTDLLQTLSVFLGRFPSIRCLVAGKNQNFSLFIIDGNQTSFVWLALYTLSFLS